MTVGNLVYDWGAVKAYTEAPRKSEWIMPEASPAQNTLKRLIEAEEQAREILKAAEEHAQETIAQAREQAKQSVEAVRQEAARVCCGLGWKKPSPKLPRR